MPIARLAGRQRGCVSVEQLLALGLTRREIGYRADAKRLHRVFRGVYLVGHDVPPPFALEQAALLATGDTAFLSHLTSAFMHTVAEAPEEVHVTVVATRRRSQDGLRVHTARHVDPRDVHRRAGLPTSSATRMILEIAATEAPATAEAVLNEALVRRRTSAPAILRAIEGSRAPGTALLRHLLDHGALDTRSEAERILLRLLKEAGLPDPDVNRHRSIGRTDLRWPGYVVEIDGFDAHITPRAFVQDRRRDRAARSDGHATDRFAAAEVVREPLRVLARIAGELRPRW